MDSAKDWVKNNYPDLLDTEKTEVSYQLAAIELLLDNLRDDLKVHALEDYIQKDARQRKMKGCLLYTSPSPRDLSTSRMPSSA